MEQINLNIYQRMLKITEEMRTVAKNLNVQVNKTSSYKAVGEKDILDAVKPIEYKYGVYSYPLKREVIETSVLETASGDYVKKQLFMRLEITYRFVNVDNPNEFVDITSYGDGIDSGDKAPGKAMTYGDKYALMKAYKISTGDDPDQNASEQLNEVSGKKQKSTANTTKASPKQWEMIRNLYTDPEIGAMLGRMGKQMEEVTIAEASKMIEARNK